MKKTKLISFVLSILTSFALIGCNQSNTSSLEPKDVALQIRVTIEHAQLQFDKEKNEYAVGDVVSFSIVCDAGYRVISVACNNVITLPNDGKYSFVAKENNKIVVATDFSERTISGSIYLNGEIINSSVISKLKLVAGESENVPIQSDGSYSFTLLGEKIEIELFALDDFVVPESCESLYYSCFKQEIVQTTDLPNNIYLTSDDYGDSRVIDVETKTISSNNAPVELFGYETNGVVPGNADDKYAITFNAKFSSNGAIDQSNFEKAKFRLLSLNTYDNSGEEPQPSGYKNSLQLEHFDNDNTWYLNLYLWNGQFTGTIWNTFQSIHISNKEINLFFSDGLSFYILKDNNKFKVYTFDGEEWHLHINVDNPISNLQENIYSISSYMNDVEAEGSFVIDNFNISLNKGFESVQPDYDCLSIKEKGNKVEHEISLVSSTGINRTTSFLINQVVENSIFDFKFQIPGIAERNGDVWSYSWDKLYSPGFLSELRLNLTDSSTSNVLQNVCVQINVGREHQVAGEEWKGLIFHLCARTNGGSIINNLTAWVSKSQMNLLGTSGLPMRLVFAPNSQDANLGSVILLVDDGTGFSVLKETTLVAEGLTINHKFAKSITLWNYVPNGGFLSNDEKFVLVTQKLYKGFQKDSSYECMVNLIKQED